MPPKPTLRFPAKPPTAPRPHVKTSIQARPAKPAPRAPPRSKPIPSSISSHSNAIPPPPGPPPPRWYQRQSIRWGSNGIAIVCAMLFIRDHFIEFQHVRGSSMAPTLSPDAHETGREDYVIVRPYLERARRTAGKADESSLKRGDVITFWKPHKPGEMGIKRVVAIEGDTVYPARGYALDPEVRVTRVSGLPDGLPDEDPDAVSSGENELGKVVVPYGHVWIEGDNWRKSLDSNDFGPISKGLIQGKAVRVWRDWLSVREVGDSRGTGIGQRSGSRVVEGRSEIPIVFLE
jgi:inner membrane protease subunit 2